MSKEQAAASKLALAVAIFEKTQLTKKFDKANQELTQTIELLDQANSKNCQKGSIYVESFSILPDGKEDCNGISQPTSMMPSMIGILESLKTVGSISFDADNE